MSGQLLGGALRGKPGVPSGQWNLVNRDLVNRHEQDLGDASQACVRILTFPVIRRPGREKGFRGGFCVTPAVFPRRQANIGLAPHSGLPRAWQTALSQPHPRDQQPVGHIPVRRGELQRPAAAPALTSESQRGKAIDPRSHSHISAETGLVALCLLIPSVLLFQDGVYFSIKEGQSHNRFGLATRLLHTLGNTSFLIYIFPLWGSSLRDRASSPLVFVVQPFRQGTIPCPEAPSPAGGADSRLPSSLGEEGTQME